MPEPPAPPVVERRITLQATLHTSQITFIVSADPDEAQYHIRELIMWWFSNMGNALRVAKQGNQS